MYLNMPVPSVVFGVRMLIYIYINLCVCAVLFGGHVLIGLSYGSGLLCGTASAGGSNLAGPGAALALGGLGCLWRHLAKDRRSSLKCCAGCVYVVLILLHDFKPLPGMIKPTHSYFSSELKPSQVLS